MKTIDSVYSASHSATVFGLAVDDFNTTVLFVVFVIVAGILFLLIADASERARGVLRRFAIPNAPDAELPVYLHDAEEIHERVRRELGADGTKKRGKYSNAERISAALLLLSSLRHTIRPEALASEIFPSDLDVIGFHADGKLRIRSISSTGARVAVGLFCLPHYLIFPGLLGGLFGAPLLGAAIGALLWVWRNYLGFYISIDFAKKRYGNISPASGNWNSGFPTILLDTMESDGKWITVLTIGNEEVIRRESAIKPDNDDLVAFVNALNWHMGRPAEVADGVYIAPKPLGS